MNRILLQALFLVFFSLSSFAQEDSTHTINANLSIGGIASSEDFLPFFLEHNRWGEVNPDQSLFARLNMTYNYHFNQDWSVDGGFTMRNDRASQYFVSGKWKEISLTVGARKETIGGINSDLTIMNYGLGRNALPVPMIELAFDYIEIPYTKGIVKVKGRLGQRWLESGRYQSNAAMQNKDFYLMLDFDQSIGFQFSAGFVHFAQYGGTDPFGVEQPNSFADWWDVFLGRGGAEGAGTAGENNAKGNHLGMYDLLFRKRLGEHVLTLNFQSPYDDRGSIQFVSLKSFLTSLNWQTPKSFKFLSTLQLEYTQSTHQSGPGIPDATPQYPTVEANYGYKFGGRDDFHNNYLYRSGYTYKGMIMGNALFHTYAWTQNFWEPFKLYEVTVTNNRIYAFNFSAKGEIIEGLDYRLQFVRSENYGTYEGLYDGRFNWGGVQSDPNFPYVYKGGLIQHYSSLLLNWSKGFLDQPLEFSALIGYDFGDIYENAGIELTMSYRLLNN